MTLTVREKVLLISLGSIALLVAVYYLIFIPQMNNLMSLKEESQRLTLEVEKTKTDLASIDKIDEETESLNTEIQQRTERFYPVILQDKLILDVDEIITKTGIKPNSSSFGEVMLIPVQQEQEKAEVIYPVKDIVEQYKGLEEFEDREAVTNNNESTSDGQDSSSLEKDNPQEQHFFESMSITMEFNGNYEEIVAFIKELEDINRTIVVKDLSLNSQQTTEGQDGITASMQIDICALPKIHQQDQEYFDWPLQNSYGKKNPFNQ